MYFQPDQYCDGEQKDEAKEDEGEMELPDSLDLDMVEDGADAAEDEERRGDEPMEDEAAGSDGDGGDEGHENTEQDKQDDGGDEVSGHCYYVA